MPKMVESLAKANNADIDATMIAEGGYFLRDHVSEGKAVASLQSGNYDVVVIQEQSVAPALPNEVLESTLPAARTLDAAADAVGTRVILYQTWGRENGIPELGFASDKQMQAAISNGYQQVARAIGADVAPVGESWLKIQRGAHHC